MSPRTMVNRQSEMIKELISENEKLRKENILLEGAGEYCVNKALQVVVVMGIALVVSLAFNIWG